MHVMCGEDQSCTEGGVAMKKQGFTLIEIMIVVAIISVLAAIAMPALAKARTRSQVGCCINNMRVLQGAVDQWRMESRKGAGTEPAMSDLLHYLARKAVCPCGGKYRGFDGSGVYCTVHDWRDQSNLEYESLRGFHP